MFFKTKRKRYRQAASGLFDGWRDEGYIIDVALGHLDGFGDRAKGNSRVCAYEQKPNGPGFECCVQARAKLIKIELLIVQPHFEPHSIITKEVCPDRTVIVARNVRKNITVRDVDHRRLSRITGLIGDGHNCENYQQQFDEIEHSSQHDPAFIVDAFSRTKFLWPMLRTDWRGFRLHGSELLP